jgi:hypothetical protein
MPIATQRALVEAIRSWEQPDAPASPLDRTCH